MTKTPPAPQTRNSNPSKPSAAAPTKPPPKKKKPIPEGEEILKKPGQRRPEPSLDDPVRAFYESLYEQDPRSLMAMKYCLEYGLLNEDIAVKVMAELRRLKPFG